VTFKDQRGVKSGMDINPSAADGLDINPGTLEVLMTVTKHVARLVRLICIPGAVDIKIPPSLAEWSVSVPPKFNAWGS